MKARHTLSCLQHALQHILDREIQSRASSSSTSSEFFGGHLSIVVFVVGNFEDEPIDL